MALENDKIFNLIPFISRHIIDLTVCRVDLSIHHYDGERTLLYKEVT